MAKAPNDNTERVTKSRRKAQEEGRRRLSAILSKEGSERFDRLRADHRSEAALIEAALNALEGANSLTDQELIDMLAARLKAGTHRTHGTQTEMRSNPVKENQMRSGIHTPPKR